MHSQHQLPSGNAGVPDSSSVRSTFYDVALVVLPVPLLVGFLAEELLSLTSGAGVAVGAAVSAFVVGYLLFGDPPTGRASSPDHGQRDGVDEPSA